MPFSCRYTHLKAVFPSETANFLVSQHRTNLKCFQQLKNAQICLKTQQISLFLPHRFHTLGSTPISRWSVWGKYFLNGFCVCLRKWTKLINVWRKLRAKKLDAWLGAPTSFWKLRRPTPGTNLLRAKVQRHNERASWIWASIQDG